MIIEIDIDIVKKSKLPIREFILLKLLNELEFNVVKDLYYDQYNTLKEFDKALKLLENLNYIIYKDNTVVLRSESEKLFSKDKIDFVELTKKIRELFPKNKKGDEQGVLNKLKQFYKNNKKFRDEDLILRATKHYIEHTDNLYIKQAHYFIYKDGISTLASICDYLLNLEENPTNEITL